LILAALAYLTALVAFYHGSILKSEVSQLLLIQGAVLGGHLLLAMAMGLHARYVILDAEGALPKRLPRKKAEKKKVEKKAEKTTTATMTTEKKTDKADQVTMGDAAENDPASGDGSDPDDVDDGDEESSDEEDEESGDTWVTVDPPHGSSQPVLKRVTPAAAAAPPPLSQKIVVPGAGSASASAGTDDSKLSKADRKALKRKLLDERLKRERKAANW
jgi:hypothetical protein